MKPNTKCNTCTKNELNNDILDFLVNHANLPESVRDKMCKELVRRAKEIGV